MYKPSLRLGGAGSTVLLGLLLWAGACASSLAQTAVTELSPAQALSCLQRPERLPKFPDGRSGQTPQRVGFVRVMMHFQAPDQAPRIKLMANTANEAMQDQVFSYLRWYRLPCLQPIDGVVKAVQEFSFRASSDEPTPVPPDAGPEAGIKSCLVMPRKSLSIWSMGHRLSHVLVQARFAAGGTAEPEIKLLHSNAPSSAEQAVRAHLAQYRMPCREDGDKAYVFEQQFSFVPEGSARPVAIARPSGAGGLAGHARKPAKLGCCFQSGHDGLPIYAALRGPAAPPVQSGDAGWQA